MKRLLAWIAALLCIYSIFTDLTLGTIPREYINISSKETSSDVLYEVVIVKRGDTVLGLIEERGSTENVPITKMIEDFMKLNDGIAPEKIQPGKQYKIPLYNKSAE